jgi:hypothetical protein
MQLWLTPMMAFISWTPTASFYLSLFLLFLTSALDRDGRSGGATVQIRVDEITNILGWKCSFVELDVQATIISSGELSCVTHPSELDLMSVKLLLKDHDLEVDTGFTFRYHDKLEDSIFLESAPTIGEQ